MLTAIWRVEPLGVPAWDDPCTHCAHPFLESTHRFRVNSNGRLHDVWLIYRCPRCGARRKRSLYRRVGQERIAPSLEAYRRDEPALALEHAFALSSPARPVPYLVAREALPISGTLCVEIAQPLLCGVRWDGFLVRELGWSRTRVRNAWASRAIRVLPCRRPSQVVRDGDRLDLALGDAKKSP